jgi:long-subunit acyl-CoA synthetase (AMP-forming)
MHVGATTIALYDTLGADQTKFIIDQTELTTMTCSFEYVKRLALLKSSEEKEVSDQSKRMMKSLVNIVSYEAVTDAETLDAAKAAGITVYSYAEIVKAGKDNTL